MPSWKGAYAFEFRGYASEWLHSGRASAVGRQPRGSGGGTKDDTEMPAIGVKSGDGWRAGRDRTACGGTVLADPMRKILRIKGDERTRAGPQDEPSRSSSSKA